MANEALCQRWRYIAFEIDSASKLARNDFLGAVISASKGTPVSNSFRITVFEGDFGILKVPHTLKDDAIKVLSSISSVQGEMCKVRTLKTSGTIRTLKTMYKHRISDSRGISE
jgi:RNase P/RNase MRP subunit POP5